MLCAPSASALDRLVGRSATGSPNGVATPASGYTITVLATTPPGSGDWESLACLPAPVKGGAGSQFLAVGHAPARVSSPAELARYLASPAISFLTGGVVDGDLTRNTRTALSGPLREDASRLLSGAPPAGLLGSGPLASTPWGTLLCADGTSGAHFGAADARWRANEAHRRYGVGAGGADDWSRLDPRFEIARNEQSPHHFGWVLESPASQGTWAGQPTKRTALGRMRHSGLAATASRGHAVVYAGDGEHGEYLYKFVGSRRTEGALDHGVLHVARLHPDGSGKWLPLVHGQGPLTPRHGWKNQADVLLRTRLAADGVGATPLPTPGRIAASGTSGEVLCALGRLSEAGGCEAAGGGARSRATSVPLLPLAGNVLRLREEGRDPAATDFRWSDEELSGRGLRKVSARAGTRASGVVRDLHYGPGGELWAVVADDGSSDDALLVVDTADGPARCVVKAEQGVLFTAAAVATDGRQSFIAVRTVGTDRRSVVLSVRGRRSA